MFQFSDRVLSHLRTTAGECGTEPIFDTISPWEFIIAAFAALQCAACYLRLDTPHLGAYLSTPVHVPGELLCHCGPGGPCWDPFAPLLSVYIANGTGSAFRLAHRLPMANAYADCTPIPAAAGHVVRRVAVRLPAGRYRTRAPSSSLEFATRFLQASLRPP